MLIIPKLAIPPGIDHLHTPLQRDGVCFAKRRPQSYFAQAKPCMNLGSGRSTDCLLYRRRSCLLNLSFCIVHDVLPFRSKAEWNSHLYACACSLHIFGQCPAILLSLSACSQLLPDFAELGLTSGDKGMPWIIWWPALPQALISIWP